jgi:hypothetical protein
METIQNVLKRFELFNTISIETVGSIERSEVFEMKRYLWKSLVLCEAVEKEFLLGRTRSTNDEQQLATRTIDGSNRIESFRIEAIPVEVTSTVRGSGRRVFAPDNKENKQQRRSC